MSALNACTREGSRRFYSLCFSISFPNIETDLTSMLALMDWQVWSRLNHSATFYMDWDDLFCVFTHA